MKVAYITESLAGHNGNGITSQALMWAHILNERHKDLVTLIDPWQNYEWREGTIVHLFGSSNTWFFDLSKKLKNYGCKVVWSPICDNIDNPKIQKSKTKMGCGKLGLFSLPFVRKKTFDIVDAVAVRSLYEKNYLKEAYGISEEKFIRIPVAMSYNDEYVNDCKKEPFCLHISSIYQERKNVVRLIEASKKYNFRLVLAGNKGSDEQYKKIRNAIDDSKNITVLGFVSEGKKIDLYKKAKVFALPSIKEGVGIVALDAAHYGCDVVVSDIGGSKEYFGGLANSVSPYSVDSIGMAVMDLLNKTNQPSLKGFVDLHFSSKTVGDILEKCYEEL